VGPRISSKVSAGFEVLGRGLLGHPMEAIKNLIPEGFLGNAGVSSPERITQGILISHYQVSFRKRSFVQVNFHNFVLNLPTFLFIALLVKMTALSQRYKNRQVQPTTPAPEVQAQILSLEKEVATLKNLFQFRDEELAYRDSIISEEHSASDRLKQEVLEANEWYTRSVASLSAELDRADQLASHPSAVQNECSEECKNAENAEVEKDKLKAEVERLEAERDKAVKAQDRSESLLIRLRARYDAG
jgi:hypothetical protein